MSCPAWSYLKCSPFAALLTALAIFPLQCALRGAEPPENDAQTPPQQTFSTVLSPDETRIEVVSITVDESAGETLETNGYVRLATGQHYWHEESGTYLPSVEEILPVESGAAALRGPHKAIFSATLDDPAGTLDVLASDGQRFRSAPLALTYFDPVTGRRATIALVKDVPGELLPPNQVIYPDAFEPAVAGPPLTADILYTYRLSGIEQDVVLRSTLPPPEDFGMSGDVARLEVLTEFYEAPVPRVIPHLIASVDDPILRAQVAAPDWIDEHLDFGGFVFGEGRAFRSEEGAIDLALHHGAPLVSKRWIDEGGRRVLSEAIEYWELDRLFEDQVPEGQAAAIRRPNSRLAGDRSWLHRLQEDLTAHTGSSAAFANTGLPRRPGSMPTPDQRPMTVAQFAGRGAPGVVIDYVALAVNLTNFTFRGDETYYVTNTVNLSGTTTLEGGSVIKFDPHLTNGVNSRLMVLGGFKSATAPYRPAVFTARDDQSVGQWITNSLANPLAGYSYGIHALYFQTATNTVDLENVRFRYSDHAVLYAGRPGTIRNGQFEKCHHAVYGSSAGTMHLHNLLILDSTFPDGAPFKLHNSSIFITEHASVVNSPNLRWSGTGVSTNLTLRNSLVVGVTTNQGYIGRSDPAYGNAEPSLSGLFKAVGAGAYYLADGSAHRDVGVTNIHATLATQLRSMTTFAPLVLTNHFSASTTLSPSTNVLRDTNTPDRGYHYPPLDYCLSTLNVTNSTLTLTNGVALGIYGQKGLVLRENGKLISEGAATALNRLVRFNTVQERGTNWGNAPSNSFALLDITLATPSLAPSINLRFTAASHLAVSTNSTSSRRLLSAGSANLVASLAMSHCQIGGLNLDVTYSGSLAQSVGLTNNLFDGCVVSFMDLSGFGTYTLRAFNNLFRAGTVSFDNQEAGNSWIIRDNLFDSYLVAMSGTYTASHNGFRSGLSTYGSSSKTGLVPDYQTGPLGMYYYPTTGTSTSLTNLINTGSQSATNSGLWHFTSNVSLLKETNSVVDIGFHYLATDGAGVPLDSDSDGFADYTLDRFGYGWGDSDYDGISDAEETLAGTSTVNPVSTVQRRLSYWRFNSSLLSESGVPPFDTNGVALSGSWSGTAASITNTDHRLRYAVETNGSSHINVRNGTVRMWFRPNWTSASAGGGGLGANNHTALLQIGPNVDGVTWVLSLWDTGNQMDLVSRQRMPDGRIVRIDALQAALSWTSNRWYNVAVTYTPTNAALYLNGELASHLTLPDARPLYEDSGQRINVGPGMRYIPDLMVRSDGIRVGHRLSSNYVNTLPCKGSIDELETFNYPLSAVEIARGAHTLPSGSSPSPTLDTDYDGRSDFAESQMDGTATNNAAAFKTVRLGHWRFNSSGFPGEQGQAPLSAANLFSSSGWSGTAANLTTSRLAYRDVETNGLPNFNCRSAGIQFWFKPSWNSGAGPTGAPLLWLGDQANPGLGHWTLRLDSAGSTLALVASSNATGTTLVSSSVSLSSGKWHHVALNCSASDSKLFLNGTQIASGSPVVNIPTAAARAVGIHVGNLPDGSKPVNGDLDELEIWNGPLNVTNIQASYQALRSLDSDLNGKLDVTEELVPPGGGHVPFLGEPFAVVGAFEAEQYDNGQDGVAYDGSGSLATVYRPSRLTLQSTTDSLPGGLTLSGYDIHLKAGEWAKYTLDVRVSGTYAVEARVAGFGTGGAFRMELVRGTTTNATTNIVLSGTNWTVAGQRLISLTAGTNIFRLVGLTNAASQSYCGRFNYLTISPSWNEGLQGAVGSSITVTGLVADSDSWAAATTNTVLIRKAIADVTTSLASPGRIILPSGRFFLAQDPPNELLDAQNNTAIFVGKSNLEIVGAGRTNTQLIAHNRATTLFSIGRTTATGITAVSNVVFRDSTLAGRPHRIAISQGGGSFTNEVEVHWLDLADPSFITGSLVSCDGNPSGVASMNIVVTNCQFRNPSNASWTMRGGNHWVDRLSIRNCDFLDRVPPDGYLTNALAPSSLSHPNTVSHPWTTAHIVGKAASARNMNVAGNTFNGNVGVTTGPNYNEYAGGDGLLWLQGGGNWFAADNVVTNHYLEAFQVTSGPSALVRNIVGTAFSTGSCTAFNSTAQFEGVTGIVGGGEDFSTHVVANFVTGSRNMALGNISVQNYQHTYRLDLGGNVAHLESLGTTFSGLPGSFCAVHTNRFLNLSGNRLTQGGHGASVDHFGGGTAHVLFNDFSGVQFRGLRDNGSAERWKSASVVGNTLNRGDSDHFMGRLGSASRWLFATNQFKAGAAVVGAQIDHASLPVHFVP